ncbi:msx2-interacting protein-like [Lytechinus pictus]|uniref:msx2-interacting protein-like n=1 Tax=Lytechinus pictus TaxID=7653 RepID=UPI0030B9E844
MWYGRVESVKLTGKRVADGTQSAYVDFVDINSATKAHDALIKIGERDLRIEYNNPDNSDDALISERGHGEYDVIHGRHSRYDSRRDG